MEILAVYEEHPIRTYGLKVQEGLWWLTALRPLAPWEDQPDYEALAQVARPTFYTADWREGRMSLRLCLEQAALDSVGRALEALGFSTPAPPRPVSLIHLQGPHFGDRHGIVAAALSSLAQAGTVPVAVNALVHSLFLLVEPQRAEAALRGLSQAFCAPN